MAHTQQSSQVEYLRLQQGNCNYGIFTVMQSVTIASWWMLKSQMLYSVTNGSSIAQRFILIIHPSVVHRDDHILDDILIIWHSISLQTRQGLQNISASESLMKIRWIMLNYCLVLDSCIVFTILQLGCKQKEEQNKKKSSVIQKYILNKYKSY